MPIISQAFPWQGIVIILAGAFLRSLYVINNKRNLRGLSPRFIVAVNLLGAGSILLALLFVTGGVPAGIDWFSWPAGIFWPLVATAAMNLVLQHSEMKALKLEDASLVAPMGAASPLFALLSGFLLLHELPTPAGWVGVALLSLGSYVLNVSKPVAQAVDGIVRTGTAKHIHTLKNFLRPWFALGKSRGVQLALLGAALGSVSINFDKMVAVHTPPFFLPGVVFTTLGICSLLFVRSADLPKTFSKKDLAWLLLSPILFAGALFLFVTALSYGQASYSSALRRAGILFVVLLAGPLLKERGHPERIWGGAIMAVGAVLLAL